MKEQLLGKKFGRLTVVGEYKSDTHGSARWLVKCDCGEIKIVLAGNLKSGKSLSCGCFRNELTIERQLMHGARSGHKTTGTYRTWLAMKARCYYPASPSFKYYGSRNISICRRWINNFNNFLSDMGERPSGMTIDRIDPNKNYKPDNCRWADTLTQRHNRRGQ